MPLSEALARATACSPSMPLGRARAKAYQLSTEAVESWRGPGCRPSATTGRDRPAELPAVTRRGALPQPMPALVSEDPKRIPRGGLDKWDEFT
jgi:hypothetical protein